MAWKSKKKHSSSDNVARRISVVSGLFFIFGGIIITRLFFIQVINSEYYKAIASRQYNNSAPEFSRGNIFFQEKNGNLVFAATQKNGFFLAVNPDLLENPESVYESLNSIVSLDKEKYLKGATKKDDPFEEILHRLDANQAQEIQKLAIKGVGVYPENWRFYPADNLASHLIGFVGFNKDELSGRYGVENYYEDVLSGEKEKIDGENILEDIFSALSKKISNPAREGYDVVLTIEPKVQSFLESELERLQEKWQTESAGGLIIEPQTGRILAMAKKPDFNPNLYNEVEGLSLFVNPLVENIFEMGSVFKPLTLAAGLNDDKINEETTYFDKGYVVFNNAKIENFDKKGRGEVNMQEVLNQSLNTGAVFVMEQLGKESFLNYVKKYGLEEKTGIDLPNEAKGNISNLKNGQDIEFATASFGQGIAVSPLELTIALASLANGGFIIEPQVVERINAPASEENIFEPKIRQRVLDSQTSERITRMLVKTVDEALLGGTIKLKNYSVAAKTGTAQILNKETGEYYENENFHSFFGYAPAFEPKFLIFLYLEKPKGVRYASQSLGVPFMNIMGFLLNYYEIPSDR